MPLITIPRIQAIAAAFLQNWNNPMRTAQPAFIQLATLLKQVFPATSFGVGAPTSLPGVSQPGDLYLDVHAGIIYIYKDTNVWAASGGGGGGVSQILAGTGISISPLGGTGIVTVSATGTGGAAGVLDTEGLPLAAYGYREILPAGNPFPTTINWWDSPSKTQLQYSKALTLNAQQNPTQIQWKFYVAGVLQATVTDTISYSGPFETTRTRTVV